MPGHKKSPKRKRRFVRLTAFLFALLCVSIIAGGILLAYLFITPLPVAAWLDALIISDFRLIEHGEHQVHLPGEP